MSDPGQFQRELESTAAAHGAAPPDPLARAVGAGTAPRDAVRCLALERTPPRPTEPAVPAHDAGRLPGLVATTSAVQARCREAVRNVLATGACRVPAMNRWVE